VKKGGNLKSESHFSLAEPVFLDPIVGGSGLTLLAVSKQIPTTVVMTSMRLLVSLMTESTLVKVAAFPTVGFLTLNWSCWTRVGTSSTFSRRDFFSRPVGT